jgi:RNA polymerase sigma-70 factor (ECF subfamily)
MDGAGGPVLRRPVRGASWHAGFDAFAQAERRRLVAFAWSLTGDVGVAEDLAQEALAAAWQKWEDVGGFDRPDTWARRVVANRAASRARRSGREQRANGRWYGRSAGTTVDLDPPDQAFWAAVRLLPERQAQAVALHYLEDRSVADIAAVLGCAEATVKVHLHRGRLALARMLGLTKGGDG